MRFKSSQVHGTGDESKTSWFFDFGQYYAEWFVGCTWYNFSFINFEVEWDRSTGRWVIDLALLGLWAKVTYIYDHSFNQEMMSLAEQIRASLEAEHPGAKIEDPNGILDQLDDKKDLH